MLVLMLCALFLSAMPVHAMERTPEGGEALETDPLIQWQSLLERIKSKSIAAEEFRKKIWSYARDTLFIEETFSEERIAFCKKSMAFYRACMTEAKKDSALFSISEEIYQFYQNEWLCNHFATAIAITRLCAEDKDSDDFIVQSKTTPAQEEALSTDDRVLLHQYKKKMAYYAEAYE